jgi:hypothetical protein
MTFKIGQPLPQMPRPVSSRTQQGFGDQTFKIEQFDRNGDGVVDAFETTTPADGPAQTSLSLLDDQGRVVERAHANDGVIDTVEQISWNADGTGTSVTDDDSKHRGRADWRAIEPVRASTDAESTWAIKLGLPPSVSHELSGGPHKWLRDKDGDGKWDDIKGTRDLTPSQLADPLNET